MLDKCFVYLQWNCSVVVWLILPVIKKYLTFIEGFFIKHIPNMANLGINSEDENEVHKSHKCFG